MMNKCMVLLAGLWMLAAGAPASADNRRHIAFDELPAAAQQFVRSHFANERILRVQVERRMIDRDYDVHLADGTSIEFDKSGTWEGIYTKYGKIPASVLPDAIRAYLREHYPDQPLRLVERDRRGYEVELGNGIELEFSPAGRLLEADRAW